MKSLHTKSRRHDSFINVGTRGTFVIAMTLACGFTLPACDSEPEPVPLPSVSIDPNRPFEPLTRQAALHKVKSFLVGLAPTANEYKAYAEDESVLPGLIDVWMQQPEFEPRAKQMFTLMFQQFAYAEDVGRYFREQNTDIFEQRQGRGGVDLQGPMGESWARTVWEMVRQDKPFTDVLTTHTYQLNVPLMVSLAYIDATPRDDANLYVPGASWLEKEYPGLIVSYTQVEQIPLSESLNPASPQFGRFTIGMPDGSSAGTNACEGLNQSHAGRAGIEEVFKYMLGVPWRTTCWSWNGAKANVFDTSDLQWRTVTLRVAKPGEKHSVFWDLDTLRSTNELVLGAEYVGFFGSLGFLANWTTNDANEHRVTANQALIVALGRTFDPGAINIPPADPNDESSHAAPGSPCYSCHVTLDPLRDFFRQSYTYWGSPRSTTPGQNDDVPGTTSLNVDGNAPVQGKGVADLGNAMAKHPRFARAWAEKICDLANTGLCDNQDPELGKIASEFESSNFNFKVLLRSTLSNPIVTYRASTRTWQYKGAAVGTALREDLCRRLEHRLGILDACNEADSLDAPQALRDQVSGAAGVLSGIGYSRGAVAPDQPIMASLFTTTAAEALCEALGSRFMGSGKGVSMTPVFTASQREAAIEAFLFSLMGIWEEDTRAGQLRAILNAHWDEVVASGGSADEALQATFVLACTAPLTTATGL